MRSLGSLNPPGNLLLTVLVKFVLNINRSMCFMSFFVFIVGYLYVSFPLAVRLPRFGKRELIFLLLFNCHYVISVPDLYILFTSVRRVFSSVLLVLGVVLFRLNLGCKFGRGNFSIIFCLQAQII